MNSVLINIAQALNQKSAKDPLESFDYKAAHQEGWTISRVESSTTGTPRVQLQKLDDTTESSQSFHEDKDAWAFVVQQAKQGSNLHLLALALVDERERYAIQASCGAWNVCEKSLPTLGYLEALMIEKSPVYKLVRIDDNAYRLDEKVVSESRPIALIRRKFDQQNQPIGWRLIPLVMMQGSKTHVWPTPEDAIVSTKLLNRKEAGAAVQQAESYGLPCAH
jgi:hypothetical protein